MCPNPYHGTKLILNLLLPTHTLLCAIIQTKYSTMAFVQWTVSPSTADPKPLYLNPEICPNFYPDPSFLTHCQFWRKKNYYVFFSSISFFIYKIYENNDTWRKFSIKIVNFCPSVQPFPPIFNCADPDPDPQPLSSPVFNSVESLNSSYVFIRVQIIHTSLKQPIIIYEIIMYDHNNNNNKL